MLTEGTLECVLNESLYFQSGGYPISKSLFPLLTSLTKATKIWRIRAFINSCKFAVHCLYLKHREIPCMNVLLIGLNLYSCRKGICFKEQKSGYKISVRFRLKFDECDPRKIILF